MTTQDLMRKLNEAEQEEEAGETEKTPEPAAAETAGSEDPENVQHRQSSTEPTTESPSNQTQVAPTVPQPEATKAPAKPGSSACECQERLSSVLYRTLLVPAETFDWNYALSWCRNAFGCGSLQLMCRPHLERLARALDLKVVEDTETLVNRLKTLAVVPGLMDLRGNRYKRHWFEGSPEKPAILSPKPVAAGTVPRKRMTPPALHIGEESINIV